MVARVLFHHRPTTFGNRTQEVVNVEEHRQDFVAGRFYLTCIDLR